MSIQVRDARSVPSPSWGHFVDPESNERYVFVLFFVRSVLCSPVLFAHLCRCGWYEAVALLHSLCHDQVLYICQTCTTQPLSSSHSV